MAFKKRWTLDDDDYIRANYQAIGAEACAEALARSIGLIYHRAHHLGVTRFDSRSEPARIVIKRAVAVPLPAVPSDFIKPPTRAQLMGKR